MDTTKDESATKSAWATDGVVFKVVEAGTPSYDHLTIEAGARGLQHQPSTLLYDALALAFNQTQPGNLLMTVLPNRPSASNLRKTLAGRGLNESDYRAFRPTYDERGQRYPKHKRPLVLQRITDQKMRLVQPFAALAENMAKEAEQRGSTYSFAQPEKPVIPGPAEHV